jgi:transglutaminase-like putative cysteine protease
METFNMKVMWMVVKIISLLFAGILLGLLLYPIPATLSLPTGPRPGVTKLTISQAARQLRQTGAAGWALVEAARALVAGRMHYCRRNSFDRADKAFERGYGYCQQQSYALADLLNRLGFEARVVGAFRNRPPDGRVGGHAWVRVTVDGETRHIDTLHYDAEASEITFTPHTKIFQYTFGTRIFYGLGSAAVNAHRYYLTGKDR